MSFSVPVSTLTTEQLAKLSGFDPVIADDLDEALAAGGDVSGIEADVTALDGRVTTLEGTTLVGAPFVDLRIAPYSLVANDTSPAVKAANTLALQAAMDTYNGTGATLGFSYGRYYFDQSQEGGSARIWSIRWGTSSTRMTKVNLKGQGPGATVLVQDGVGNGGDWSFSVIDYCNDCSVRDMSFEQGTIERPDPGQQNHLIAWWNSETTGNRYTERVDFINVEFGKVIGDAFALRAGITYPVRNIRLLNFRMKLDGSCILTWTGSTTYQIGHEVHTDGKRYRCLKAGTSAPSGGPTGTQVFTFADFTYTADNTTNVFTAVGHGLQTGDGPCWTSTSSALPAGLVPSTNYYIIRLTADTFQLATSAQNAQGGIAIDITTNGTGTQTLADVTTGVQLTRHSITDGTAVWDYQPGGQRLGARSGISFQGGYRDWVIGDGYLYGAQNSLLDMESSSVGEREGMDFYNLFMDQTFANSNYAVSAGSTSAAQAKNIKFRNCTIREGVWQVTYVDGIEFDNCRTTITEALNDSSTAATANMVVRGTVTDMVLRDCLFERSGATAGYLVDIEGSTTPTTRITIEGGRYVQSTAAFPIFINGVRKVTLRNPLIHYKASSGASSVAGIVVEAVNAIADDFSCDAFRVVCDTGEFYAAIDIETRNALSMNNISIRGVVCAGEVTDTVLIGYGAGTTIDLNPVIQGCDKGSSGNTLKQVDGGGSAITTINPVVGGNKGGIAIYEGTGVPTFSAVTGSQFMRLDGGASTTLYVNTSASSPGTTWTAK